MADSTSLSILRQTPLSSEIATKEWTTENFLSISDDIDAGVSAVTMNGDTKIAENNVIDLGTVLTVHQSLSDIYILSGELVEGLSNVVIPKLDTISGLVEEEVNKVDEISAKLDDYSLIGHSHVVSDITDFPPIPTVNNGTLTIQRNGSTVQTFTANQDTSVSANIIVPTKTSDLTNDSGYVVSSDLTKVMEYQGSVTTYNDLPNNAEKGDVYNVVSAYGDYPPGTNYAYNGSAWDPLGGSIDLSKYALTTQLSDIPLLKADVATISNDLSIDIGRVIVTEDNGYEQGQNYGFLASYDFSDGDSYTNDGGYAIAFPVSELVNSGAWTLAEIKNACYGADNDPYFESNAGYVIGYGNQSNGNYGVETNSITGYFDGVGTVYAHYGSQFGADMIEWQDSNGNPQDGTAYIELPTKVIERAGQYVYRTPYYYYYYSDGTNSRVSFVLVKDREAIKKTTKIPFEDKVSSTYATKTEVQTEIQTEIQAINNEITAISDDLQTLESHALTSEKDPIFNNWLSNDTNKIIGSNKSSNFGTNTNVIGNNNVLCGDYNNYNLIVGNGLTTFNYVGDDGDNTANDNVSIASTGKLSGCFNTLIHSKFTSLNGHNNIFIDNIAWPSVVPISQDLSVNNVVYLGRNLANDPADPIESNGFYVHGMLMADENSNIPYARLSANVKQSDWTQTNQDAIDFIKNKPSIPTKTSDLTNDSGFLTSFTETDPIFTAWVSGSRISAGSGASVTADNGVAIGTNAKVGTGVAVGNNASNTAGVSLGISAVGTNGISIGRLASSSTGAVAVGISCDAKNYDIAIGYKAKAPLTATTIVAAGNAGIAIGQNTEATAIRSLAIGNQAYSTASNAIQLGRGTNNEVSSFQVLNYKMLDGRGYIPKERLSSALSSYDDKIAELYDTNLWIDEGSTDIRRGDTALTALSLNGKAIATTDQIPTSADYVSKTLTSDQTIKSALVISGGTNGYNANIGANNSTVWFSAASISDEVYVSNNTIGYSNYNTGAGTELHFPSQDGTIATEEKLTDYVDLSSIQTITGKKYFTNEIQLCSDVWFGRATENNSYSMLATPYGHAPDSVDNSGFELIFFYEGISNETIGYNRTGGLYFITTGLSSINSPRVVYRFPGKRQNNSRNNELIATETYAKQARCVLPIASSSGNSLSLTIDTTVYRVTDTSGNGTFPTITAPSDTDVIGDYYYTFEIEWKTNSTAGTFPQYDWINYPTMQTDGQQHTYYITGRWDSSGSGTSAFTMNCWRVK